MNEENKTITANIESISSSIIIDESEGSAKFKEDLRLAATAMLTDTEICEKFKITPNVLELYYSILVEARNKLKIALNQQAISDAITNGKANELADKIPQSKDNILSIPKRKGGPQPGSGRPKGSINKLTAFRLLGTIEEVCGQPFDRLIAEGYKEAIERRDRTMRIKYEQLFMNKVMAQVYEMGSTEELSKDEIETRVKELIEIEIKEKNANSSSE